MSDREESPAFQWYPKDYLTSTPVMMMSLAQEGLYRRLLDYQWLNGWVPADLAGLAKLCRISTKEAEKLWPGVAPCFEQLPDGRGLVNPRLEREREKQRAYRERMERAGKAGAAGRWGGRDRTPEAMRSHNDGNAIASNPQCDSMALQSPSSSPSSTAVENPPKPPAAAPHRAAKAAPTPRPPKSKWQAPEVEIPQELRTPAFLEAWAARLRERGEPGFKGSRPSESSLRAQLGKLQRLAALRGLGAAVACVERATEGRHEGVVFPNDFEEPRNGRHVAGGIPTPNGKVQVSTGMTPHLQELADRMERERIAFEASVESGEWYEQAAPAEGS